MKLVRPHRGQRCTFRIDCNEARQASLVIDIFPGMPQIFPLQNVAEGVWETELRLPPGDYRFCYHLYDGRALQYITPTGLAMDGLKAVLHVGPYTETDNDDDPLAQPNDPLRRRRLTSPLPTPAGRDPLTANLFRRAAG
ncbi:hypothetical protein ACERK3_05040 [Phycisphaerales bacterium AB-hyl4]|uniref:Uncharacterized protein n=1 Tax=Natronomicrosphaera hydrolytica TaxID=3242702 RepID=A0ABV4U4I0_9BACT